jgi:toxin ParE1/3/4
VCGMEEARPLGLRFTAPPLADLDSLLTYLAANSPQGAARVGKRLREVIDLPMLHPHIGARTQDPTIRRAVARPYPYLIFYAVTGDTIVIHAVRHSARDPSTMPGVGRSP